MRDSLVALSAALLTAALEAIGRFAWEGPYLPELMAEKFFALIPVWAFTPLFRTFGYHSKYYAFGGMIAAEVAGLTLVGTAFRRWARRRWLAGWRMLPVVATVAGVISVVTLVGLLPLVDAGVAGQALPGGARVAVPNLPASRRVLCGGARAGGAPVRASGEDRRSFLGRALTGLGLVGLARAADTLTAGAGRGLAHAQEIWAQVAGLSTEVTPTEKFYVVSKNIFDSRIVRIFGFTRCGGTLA